MAGPAHPLMVARRAPGPPSSRPVRSVFALVVFAVVLGLVVALVVTAVVGISVLAIQKALNG